MNQLNNTLGQILKPLITSVALLLICFLFFIRNANAQPNDSLKVFLQSELNGFINSDFFYGKYNYSNGKKVVLDSVYKNFRNDTLVLQLGKTFAEMPFRENHINVIQDSLRNFLPDSLKRVPLKIVTNGKQLRELVPNYYRNTIKHDKERFTHRSQRERRNVVQKERLYEITAGLESSNIALWNSHGWYYEQALDRWEWQRARLFTTLEDISPTAFVIPYIAPMLENAGANVFIPRERDWQPNEVIVDNNLSTADAKFKKPKGKKQKTIGFAIGRQPYKNENPFELGTAIRFENSKKGNGATYIPEIPEAGYYGVYVSYGKGEGKVNYRVFHSGGSTDFVVDQQMGYGTWVYLGKFHFKKGFNKKESKVELIVPKGTGLKFSADAVRFGGGMGVVERHGKTGGRAKFFEGARYFLQYSGAPDTLVWSLNNGENDYVDDYKCRGEWVDWLIGAPFGPTKNRMYPGLKIPIDMAFAFHTDAGILPDDGIVGTLGIYSTDRDTNIFADGQSKYASRDLTDLVQSQIVDDINAIYKSNWTRRGMWDAQYSEAYRPQVPTMLLELLSHQNLNDVKYVLNPKFRFDVSRAIYKGMLRFLSTQNGYDYVVQPLPVDHLQSEFIDMESVKISWQPVFDSLEATAVPKKYMVYQRIGENGFNNGTLVEQPEIIISGLEKGKVYGFKITAVNDGGESFPSEIISVGIADKCKGEILLVNGFDRVDGPAVFETDSFAGVFRQFDHGVADGYDLVTTGDQYEFKRKSTWSDDDNPGHGASYADLETTIFRGNTFDFSYVNGASVLANGYSFITVSDEAVEDGLVKLKTFPLVDFIYGEEKTTIFPGKDKTPHFEIYTKKMLQVMDDYSKSGGNMIISGAYIGSEISGNKETVERVGKLLGIKCRTNYAVKNGQFYSTLNDFKFKGEFNTGYCLEQYTVEAPDGIDPFDDFGKTILRYSENNISGGVFYNGSYKVIVLGFPFEAVKGEVSRNELMKGILELLTN